MRFIITVDKRQDWWSLASRLIADEPLAAVATSATHFDKLLTLFHSVKIPEISNTLTFGLFDLFPLGLVDGFGRYSREED